MIWAAGAAVVAASHTRILCAGAGWGGSVHARLFGFNPLGCADGCAIGCARACARQAHERWHVRAQARGFVCACVRVCARMRVCVRACACMQATAVARLAHAAHVPTRGMPPGLGFFAMHVLRGMATAHIGGGARGGDATGPPSQAASRVGPPLATGASSPWRASAATHPGGDHDLRRLPITGLLEGPRVPRGA